MNAQLKYQIVSGAKALGFVFCGVIFGVLLAGKMNQKISDEQRSSVAKQVDDEMQLQELRREKISWQSAMEGWQGRAQACEANYTTFTVLYEPGQPLSIPVLHGLLDLQAGPATGLQTPAHPAWILPAKIEPRVIAAQPGLLYGYMDRETKQLDGPYPATVVAMTDKFGVKGWAPR